MKPNLNKRLLSVPNPKLSLLIDMKLSSKEFTNEFIPEKIIPPSSSDNQKDEELEEELKDNIAYLDNNNFSIRKVYRLSAKNPYSLLQQPIIKRFSHNFTIRESLTPTRASVKGIKSDQNCLSDLGLKLSDNIFPLPKDHHSLEESLSRSKTKVFEKADRDENFSIYEGKTRNSIIANIDDFQRSFFLKNTRDEVRLQNFNPRKNESNDFNINGSILKNSNEGNETELEFANEERKMLYEYLVDFMVLNLDDQETDENNFLMDVETEKLQKELNDIPGFYKKLKLTVGMKECAFLQVVKMNELEKIKIDFELYPDSFPCLSVRKNLLLLKR